MFHPDQHTIATYALQSPQHLYRVGCFVLSTVNQRFEQVQQIMAIMEHEGPTSKQLSPNTRRGMEALASEAQRLYHDFAYLQSEVPKIRQNREHRHELIEHTIIRMVQFPGFGIVKSAFYVQLVLGITGCLDRWNCRQAGLDERVCAYPQMRPHCRLASQPMSRRSKR